LHQNARRAVLVLGRIARSPCGPDPSVKIRCHFKCHRRRTAAPAVCLPLYPSA
jgi:hypothetical protein